MFFTDTHHIRKPSEESGSSGTDYDGEDLITATNLKNDFETDTSSDTSTERPTSSRRRLVLLKKRSRDAENEASSSDESGPKDRKKMRKHTAEEMATSKVVIEELANNGAICNSPVTSDMEQLAGSQFSNSSCDNEMMADDADSCPLPESTNDGFVNNTIGTLTPLRHQEDESTKSEREKRQVKRNLSLNKVDESKKDKGSDVNIFELNLSNKTGTSHQGLQPITKVQVMCS